MTTYKTEYIHEFMEKRPAMDEFLLKDYERLSNLWARRDEMRLSFLRFYFLFLGGIVTVFGFFTENNGTDFECLLNLGIVKALLGVASFAGLVTFALINNIRVHNLMCIVDMQAIIDIYHRNHSEDRFTRLSFTPIFNLKSFTGIDFYNSLFVGIMNNILGGLFFYGFIKCWAIIPIIMFVGLHIFLRVNILSFSKFSCQINAGNPIAGD